MSALEGRDHWTEVRGLWRSQGTQKPLSGEGSALIKADPSVHVDGFSASPLGRQPPITIALAHFLILNHDPSRAQHHEI